MTEPPKRRGPVLMELDEAPVAGTDQPDAGARSPDLRGPDLRGPDQRERKAPRADLREGEAAPSPAPPTWGSKSKVWTSPPSITWIGPLP